MDTLRQPNFDHWVAELGTPHRAKRAYWRLVLSGNVVMDAVRRGLQSPLADVRMHCARILDHLVDERSIPDLVALLDDEDAGVRLQATHALACDRCKDNACRPEKATVLPRAIALLSQDPDAHVRAMAIELVGRWMHSDADAVLALESARDADPSPAVRKKARWYSPGGTIYRKRAPS